MQRIRQIIADEASPSYERTLTLTPDSGGWTWRSADDVEGHAQLSALSSTEGWLEVEGRVVPYRLARKGNEIEVWLEGQVYRFAAATEGRRSKGASGAASGELKAPMPGTVLRVLCSVGDEVAEKAPLVIMESMKMELTLAAPFAGVVADVPAAEGSLVEMGTMLVRVQAPEAPHA